MRLLGASQHGTRESGSLIQRFLNGAGGSGTISFALIAVSGTEVRFNDDMRAMRVIADQAAITFEFITRSGELIDFFKLTAVE